MSTHVNVHSVQAIADFRASLATFAEVVATILDEVDLEVRRSQEWILHEQPAYWRQEVQRARDAVVFARNELERAQNAVFDGQRPTCYQQKKALEAARRRLSRADEKVEIVRRAAGALRTESAEFQGRMVQLRELLTASLPTCLALMSRMLDALEGYTASQVGMAAGPAANTSASTTTHTTGAPAEATAQPAHDAAQSAEEAPADDARDADEPAS